MSKEILFYGTNEVGGRNTWHDSEQLDIEMDGQGKVVAVWFRCMMLPFKVEVVDEIRARGLERIQGDRLPALLAVSVEVER